MSPPWEEKDQTTSQSPVSAPCHSLVEVCPLRLKSPWCPQQSVLSVVRIVTMLMLPSSPIWAAYTDNDGGFLLCLGRGGQKGSGNGTELSSQADPGQLLGPTSHWEEAWRVQLPVSPFLSQTWGSKGEQSHFTEYGPIKVFHGEFHGDHFILMVSIVIWVPLPVSGAQGSRWGMVLPGQCSPCKDTSSDLLPYVTTFEHLRNTEHLLAVMVVALRS